MTVMAHKTGAEAGKLAAFQWDDPFLLEDQLSDEERMVRDTARASPRRSSPPASRRASATRLSTARS